MFTNAMLGTFADQRKYIRNLKALFGTQPYKTYIQRESKAAEQIAGALEAYGIGGMEDLKAFVESQAETKAELSLSWKRRSISPERRRRRTSRLRNVAK